MFPVPTGRIKGIFALDFYFFVIVLHIFFVLFQNAVKLGGTWGFIANLLSSSKDTTYIELKLGT
jgi:hypothetical protein